MIDTIHSTSPDTSGFRVHRWVRQEKRLLMGIFNIKSFKDKYTPAEESTDSAGSTATSPVTSIADGVRALIKKNPDLADKNRYGVRQRAVIPAGSNRETVSNQHVQRPVERAEQENDATASDTSESLTPKTPTPEPPAPEPLAAVPARAENFSPDGTVTIDAQPLTLTETEATADDILPLDEEIFPIEEEIEEEGVQHVEHHAPTVDKDVLAEETTLEPRRATPQARTAPSTHRQEKTSEHTPLFKLSPGTFTRSGVHNVDGPFQALFVCTGNIARSASGEVISKKLAEEYGLADTWTFASAGTGALVGQGVYKPIATELIKRGYNPEGFVSRQLTEEMVNRATIILVAEKTHADWIVREWPQHHVKIKLLKQAVRIRLEARRAEPLSYLHSYGGSPLDTDKLEDPYRRGPAAAKVAVDEVEESLRIILPWLARAHR